MRNISAITCVMLTFSVGAHAMDVGMLNALAPESVPPALPSRQTVPLATPKEGALAPSVGENEEPRARPVIVVRLQPVDPILDHTADNVAVQQSDADWETRRKDRLARFAELAARNTASHNPASQL